MITQPDKVGLLLEAISIELHDDAMVELDNCEKTTCRYEKMVRNSGICSNRRCERMSLDKR